MLPDKRLLVLAGATHGPEVPFKLFVADPMRETAKPIGTLAGVTGPGDKMKTETGKAEGVTLLDVTGKSASAVIPSTPWWTVRPISQSLRSRVRTDVGG